MIIRRSEIHQMVEYFEWRTEKQTQPDWWDEDTGWPEFFLKYPHLVFPLGYKQFKPFDTVAEFGVYSTWPDYWKFGYHFMSSGSCGNCTECLYLDESSNEWHLFNGLVRKEHFSGKQEWGDSHFSFTLPDTLKAVDFDTEKWLRLAEDYCKEPPSLVHTLYFSGKWARAFQTEQRDYLAERVHPLLTELQAGKTSLRRLHWRTLEEVVAELLRQQGLEIILTPRSRDGGRDIIARGELVPGKASLVAVEVKQRDVVGVADLHGFLGANQEFPILMLATAGRFSSGVIRESVAGRDALRIILKDGIAIREWVDSCNRPSLDAKT